MYVTVRYSPSKVTPEAEEDIRKLLPQRSSPRSSRRLAGGTVHTQLGERTHRRAAHVRSSTTASTGQLPSVKRQISKPVQPVRTQSVPVLQQSDPSQIQVVPAHPSRAAISAMNNEHNSARIRYPNVIIRNEPTLQVAGVTGAVSEPRHAQYATYSARLQTYYDWSPERSHSPHQMADAGFFYARKYFALKFS